jgi:hypothetical protein
LFNLKYLNVDRTLEQAATILANEALETIPLAQRRPRSIALFLSESRCIPAKHYLFYGKGGASKTLFGAIAL